jgi:hypothetical protein
MRVTSPRSLHLSVGWIQTKGPDSPRYQGPDLTLVATAIIDLASWLGVPRACLCGNPTVRLFFGGKITELRDRSGIGSYGHDPSAVFDFSGVIFWLSAHPENMRSELGIFLSGTLPQSYRHGAILGYLG